MIAAAALSLMVLPVSCGMGDGNNSNGMNQNGIYDGSNGRNALRGAGEVIDDAGDAILSVAANGVDGKTYPLGSGQGRKLSEYIEEIRQIINPSVKVQYGVKDYYPHQPMHLVADISELTNDTGWQPRTSFEEGIRSFV